MNFLCGVMNLFIPGFAWMAKGRWVYGLFVLVGFFLLMLGLPPVALLAWAFQSVCGFFVSEKKPNRGVQVIPEGRVFLSGDEDDVVDVVGESHYQSHLNATAGGKKRDSQRVEVAAVLVPEPNNKKDPNAIQVWVNGAPIGYLSRADALAMKATTTKLWNEGSLGYCNGIIVGGWKRGGDEGHYGVKLFLSEENFQRPPRILNLNVG